MIKRRKTTASPTENHRFPYKNHWFRRRKPDVDVNVIVYVSGGEEEEAYTHKHQNPEIPLFRIMQQNPQ